MNKNIKNIELMLDDNETINIPAECIKKLKINTENIKIENNEPYIINLDLLIQNNGEIHSDYDIFTNPIKKLNECNNISAIAFSYKNSKTDTFNINWIYKNDNSPFELGEENQAQTSKMKDYKTIHISINPNNVTYFLEDIFNFPIGTKFKTEHGQIVEIKEDTNGEKEIKLTESMINTGFYKLN